MDSKNTPRKIGNDSGHDTDFFPDLVPTRQPTKPTPTPNSSSNASKPLTPKLTPTTKKTAKTQSSITAQSSSPPPNGVRRKPDSNMDLDLTVLTTLSVIPFKVLFWTSVLFFAVYWVPEMSGIPGLDVVLEQLSPLVSKGLVTQGASIVSVQSIFTIPAGFSLLAATILAFVSRRVDAPSRMLVLPSAGILAISSFASVVVGVLSGYFQDCAVGLLTCVAIALCALTVIRKSARVNYHNADSKPLDLVSPLAVFAVTLVGPIALGRFAFTDDVRQTAQSLVDAGEGWNWSLFTWSTALQWTSGASVAISIVLALRFVPPRATKSLIAPTILLILAVGLGGIVVGNMTREESNKHALTLATEHPSVDMVDACSSWWRLSSPQLSIHVRGSGCDRISTFVGSVRTSDVVTPFQYSSTGWWTTPEKAELDRGPVTGLYGDVLVAVGSVKGYDEAATVTGFNLSDGHPVWNWRCDNWIPFSVRLAGVTAGDEPSNGRLTMPGEGPAVVIECKGLTVRLNPETGAII